jgi:hypothetical protein
MPDEQERWAKLVAFLENGPAVGPVVLPVQRHTVGAIRAQLERTAWRVRVFADELHELGSVEGPPADGSTQAIALVLASVCRTLARNWCDQAPVTDVRVCEFNREIEFLCSMFGVPTTRTPGRFSPLDDALARGGGLGRRATGTSCQDRRGYVRKSWSLLLARTAQA